MDIHCVVTGQDESGKSVILRDTPLSLSALPSFRAMSYIAYGEATPSLNFHRTGLRHRSPATSRPRVVSVSRSSPYHRISNTR